MNTIFKTIKTVAFEIDNAIKTADLGYSDSENSSGEDQLKLDVQSDIIIEKAFASVAIVKNLVSEEKEGVLELNEVGKYTICYDRSLISANKYLGSLFILSNCISSNIVYSLYCFKHSYHFL